MLRNGLGKTNWMSVELSDAEIQRLLAESKVLPLDYRQRLGRWITRFKHRKAKIRLTGVDKGQYTIMLRENLINPFDFSAILGYRLPQTTRIFRLRRYNGTGHRHTNRIESETFRGFHIHQATERYQELGAREDSFAEQTKRFNTLDGAINCLLRDCSCSLPENPDQPKLFSGESRDTS